jgi:hypothetical protein
VADMVWFVIVAVTSGAYLYWWNKARQDANGWRAMYNARGGEIYQLRELLKRQQRPGHSIKYDYMILAEDIEGDTKTSILYYAPDGEEILIAFHSEGEAGWPANETWKDQKIAEHQSRLRSLRAMGEL